MKKPRITVLKGTLQINHERGVIYFHLDDEQEILKRGIATPLRICCLPAPIPRIDQRSLDITHMGGCDWSAKSKRIPVLARRMKGR